MNGNGNKYTVFHVGREPFETDLPSMASMRGIDLEYIAKIFRNLEEQYSLTGWDVFIIHNSNLDINIPSARKSIVVIMGEEHCHIPKYLNSADFVFTRISLRPMFFGKIKTSVGTGIAAIEFFRNALNWTGSGLRAFLQKPGPLSPILDLPVGYGMQAACAPIPILERPYLASFYGSLRQNAGGLGRIKSEIGLKTYVRRRFARELAKLEETVGEDRLKKRLAASYSDSRSDEGKEYSEVLSRTQISLAPRGGGNSGDSTRICESLRYGCVVISDRLPDRWFYRGSPIIQIDDWKEMHEAVADLAASPSTMERLGAQSLAWWENVCAERPVAEFMAETMGLRKRARDHHPSLEPRF